MDEGTTMDLIGAAVLTSASMQCSQRFREVYARHRVDPSFPDEILWLFESGVCPEKIPSADRHAYETACATFRDSAEYQARPLIQTEIRRLLDSTPARLDVASSCRPARFGLTPEDVDLFAMYGVLPPITLAPDSLRHVEEIDRLCTTFVNGWNGERLGLRQAWLFNQSLLELATSDELVDRVSSLLGDNITFMGTDGPFYLPPGSSNAAPWHTADGPQFGGGTYDVNFDLVTAWIALSDANVESGCMTMVAGSFHHFYWLHNLAPDLLTPDPHEAVSRISACPRRIEAGILEKILCRRFSRDHENRRLPRTAWITDRILCGGIDNLKRLTELETVALEARRGQAILFSSLNVHTAFPNRSTRWRKALSFRYMKTNDALPERGFSTHAQLKRYTELVPATGQLLDRMGRSVDDFATASPRLCLRGQIPEGQERVYLDRRELLAALREQGGSCIGLSEPSPSYRADA
jgi:ectoine hydroxylase-related dioxygenase (phytanoyl-CoA dioxygenase family)